jgi:hypothetical protein
MDGTAAVGTAVTFARADHVHPIDTSRAPLVSPALTGTPTAPTATAGTSTTQIATTAFTTTAIAAIAIPQPSTTAPLMDGTAAAGTGTTWARADHVHPHDSTIPAASTTTPAALGTAAVGTAATFARADHVHTLPAIPAASTTTPVMDGTAAVGTAATFARADHVHPTDTAAFSGVQANAGYQKLPNGLIMQWIRVNCTYASFTSFSWPIAFPNALLAAVPGGFQGLNFSGSLSVYMYSSSLTGGTVIGNNGASATSVACIIAIGN